MNNPTDVLERWQDPQYTGANRCFRCTLVNAIISIVGIGAVTGILSFYSTTITGVISGSFATLFAASMIYFKGYLVPGTPTLTKRYFPESVLSWFGKFQSSSESNPATALDFESVFMEHRILEECEEIDDLCVNDTFHQRWQRARGTIDDPEVVLRETIAADPSTTQFSGNGASVRLNSEEQFIEWPSRAALTTDASSAAVLRESAWFMDRPIEERVELLGRLRFFIDTCPDCAGEVALEMETVESCCSEYDVYAASCQGCEARLVEVQP